MLTSLPRPYGNALVIFAINGSDNDALPVWHQAINKTNASYISLPDGITYSDSYNQNKAISYTEYIIWQQRAMPVHGSVYQANLSAIKLWHG